MVTFYGSSLLTSSVPSGEPLDIRGAKKPGLVTKNGLVLFGNDGKAVSVQSHLVVFLLSPQFLGNGFL
jgi:formyltetrahydrofolate dehydrogenase